MILSEIEETFFSSFFYYVKNIQLRCFIHLKFIQFINFQANDLYLQLLLRRAMTTQYPPPI